MGNNQRDIIADVIGDSLATEARFEKASQRLFEKGELTYTLQDIGGLCKEVALDIESECIDDIKDMLWNYHRKAILRRAIRSLAKWYSQEVSSISLGGDNK